MVKWYGPDVDPELECGDRIVLVLQEMNYHGTSLVTSLLILEATEDRWICENEIYLGYTPGDGLCWCYEKSLIDTTRSTGWVSDEES